MRKKGGFADAFYTSYAWRQCAAAYRKSRGYLCERCLARGIVTTAREVHHIKHLTRENLDNPDIALNWDNLQLLCDACHDEQHSEQHKRKRYRVDEKGRCVVTEPPLVPGGK